MTPLAGVKVIEMTENIAGPFAGLALAQLGADVIKIERPGRGDDTRFWGPPVKDGAGYSYHAFNHSKRSLALDVTNPDDLARLRHMIVTNCDVFLQNMRPGTTAKLGLDAKTLRAENPRLVTCSLWAYGNQGPKCMEPGFDPVIQAFSGLFSLQGDPGSPPARIGVPITDFKSGLWSAFGCLAALMERERTGKGCEIDASLFESALSLMTILIGRYMTTGEEPIKHRTGALLLGVFQAFDTADGEIHVAAANDRLFVRFATAVGRPEWVDDPRFATTARRVENNGVLLPAIHEIMRNRTTAQWRNLLEADQYDPEAHGGRADGGRRHDGPCRPERRVAGDNHAASVRRQTASADPACSTGRPAQQ